MFAHNNSEIDYFRMAVVNAGLIKKHLGPRVNVCVATDPHSYDFVASELGEDAVNKNIDDLVVIEKNRDFKYKNSKVYRDTIDNVKSLSFYNVSRPDAYDVSPYDETILLDTDYMILGDTLNQCWRNRNPMMMNYTWQDINFSRKFDLDRLSIASITQYWATVVYFNRSEYAENFFTLCKQVRKNYSYYKNLYRWSGSTYRNDYVFSIAAHLLNGLTDKCVPELPFKLYKSFDFDDVYKVNALNEISMFLEKHDSPGEFLLSKWKDMDLHVMNKWALNRISTDVLELLHE